MSSLKLVTDNTDKHMMFLYHEENPFCEWSYWVQGKKRYNKHYIEKEHINDVLCQDIFLKIECHHIFGRVTNEKANLINILQTPLHSRSHSHNSNYNKDLIIDYCLIKFAKGEMGIKFIKKYWGLNKLQLIRKRYQELKNVLPFQRACDKYLRQRLAYNQYDVLDILEDFDEGLQVIQGDNNEEKK